MPAYFNTCNVRPAVHNNFSFMLLDVNECDLNIDDCDQLCVNDFGSYHCECYSGYFRDNYSSSCVGW